jgi:hypothetical protein
MASSRTGRLGSVDRDLPVVRAPASGTYFWSDGLNGA